MRLLLEVMPQAGRSVFTRQRLEIHDPVMGQAKICVALAKVLWKNETKGDKNEAVRPKDHKAEDAATK